MAEYRILPVLCKRAPNYALESEAVLQRDKKNARMLKGRTGYVISEEGPFRKGAHSVQNFCSRMWV